MFVSNQSEAVDTALSRGSVNASVNTTNIMMIPAEPKKITGEVRRRRASCSFESTGNQLLCPKRFPAWDIELYRHKWPIHLAGSSSFVFYLLLTLARLASRRRRCNGRERQLQECEPLAPAQHLHLAPAEQLHYCLSRLQAGSGQ